MSSSMLLSTSPLNADSQRPSASTDRVLQPRHDALPPWSRLSLKCGKESVDPDSCHARTVLAKHRRPHLQQRLHDGSCANVTVYGVRTYPLIRIRHRLRARPRIDAAHSYIASKRASGRT
ncbi:hypothetical protein DFH06DRAFT_1480209 [Mycena polygramma]|nr:hypothetical protein DFH06DRAFT_1480209 [Mycena polygramma]